MTFGGLALGVGMILKPQGPVTQVRTLPASAGWTWMREALAIFWRQPFAFTALVILYTMVLMLVANVPVLGMPIAAVLVPFGTVGLTLAALGYFYLFNRFTLSSFLGTDLMQPAACEAWLAEIRRVMQAAVCMPAAEAKTRTH
jgi:hypothetical protein